MASYYGKQARHRKDVERIAELEAKVERVLNAVHKYNSTAVYPRINKQVSPGDVLVADILTALEGKQE